MNISRKLMGLIGLNRKVTDKTAVEIYYGIICSWVRRQKI